METRKSDNIFGSYVFFVTKVIGLWIYDKNMDISKRLLTLAILIRFIEIIFSLINIINILKNFENNGNLRTIAILFCLAKLLFVLLNFCHINSEFREKSLWKYLAVQKFNRNHFKLTKITLYFVNILFILLLGALVFDVIKKSIPWYLLPDRLLTIHFYWTFVIVIIHFCTCLQILITLMKEINIEMASMGDQIRTADLRKIKLLTNQHSCLIDIAEIVNRAFGWQNIIIYSILFIITISSLFGFVRRFTSDLLIVTIARQTTIFFLSFGLIVVPVYLCEDFKQEVNQFNMKLFYFVKRRFSDGFQDDELQFYTIMKRNMSFTAGGCINLGYPLILSIINSAATFLVILIQFTN
uniref:Gustatory receptor n=1 Tax=Rhodnius prolixus TaxID=13249 RepID=T1HAY8_RHOPR